MAFSHFCKNGDILPIEEATIPLQNIEYSYGFGVYESFGVSKGAPRFMDEHIDRLLQSADLVGIEHTYTKESIAEWTQRLIQRSEGDRYNLKILLIGAPKPSDALLTIMPHNPLFPDKRLYKSGIHTLTVEYERPIPNAKTLNMLRSYLAHKQAKEADCHEGLSLHDDGCIYEGTRSNFFTVKNNVIITPPTEKILAGITREHVLALAKKERIEIQEAPISLENIGEFDGAFLTSSSMKVMPIAKINNTEFTIPDTTKTLIKLYDEFLLNS